MSAGQGGYPGTESYGYPQQTPQPQQPGRTPPPGYPQGGYPTQGTGESPNPYQQPGFHQANPYQQPTVPGAGAGYGVAGGQTPDTAPLPPVPPDGGGKGGRGRLVGAIIAATALVAAVAVGGVVLVNSKGDGDGDGGTAQPAGEEQQEQAGPDQDEKGEAEPTEGGAEGEDEELRPDDPRAGVTERPDPVVADDWQVQTHTERNNAFDVPPDWEVDSESVYVGYEFEHEGEEMAFILSAPVYYMEGYCGSSSSRIFAGTTGSLGATDTAASAEHESRNWVLAAYDREQQGTLTVGEAEPFSSEHGLEGHISTSTVENVPVEEGDECAASSGKVIAISYKDAQADIVTWLMIMDLGYEGEPDQATIDKIVNSLRPYGVDAD
ncbi:hypothetical protein [Streptomyces aidingensis]|uniref:DUF8017 domain-containing protein n=1 Tax=Streptomyces aidingensis TaxID=910347 RepID=A0A1I1F3V4_9ACTN|nr:hypothetical protein [Streptomyces aidingensis]SFB94004.1 hypothetical protein SAMN05421773_101607 [Streptomyces aidingensis]